ncbi:p-loop containing nucleoside triphosphate hydrolase protein [Favolaschia claudopus]|uniref:P-loop containing nucleoside triphosphate hydrolase protein n=1 Tax=Favolaschia claudopus TaxID=2862362 RepID=A0AAW0AYE1_9AGAR
MAEVPVPGSEKGMLLEVQRIEKIRLPDSDQWLIQSAQSKDAPSADKYAEWARYAFVVRQKIRHDRLADSPTITTTLLIRSTFLRNDLFQIMKQLDYVAWHASILKLDPMLVLNFLPRLSELAIRLSTLDEKEFYRKEHLTFFIEFLQTEYANTIQKISNFVKHGEITFDFMWAVFTPGNVIFSTCNTTGEPRAYRLHRIVKQPGRTSLAENPHWVLTCEYVEALTPSPSGNGLEVIFATEKVEIPYFSGVKQIAQLAAYPGHFHPDSEQLQNRLIERGRRWMALRERHHKEYTGIAVRWREMTIVPERERVQVSGRIMIDRVTFIAANPNYEMPSASIRRDSKRDFIEEVLGIRPPAGLLPRGGHFPSSAVKVKGKSLSDSELLITTPLVYGFSFTDKRWWEFNVDQITDIQWNAEAFSNLAIDPARKILVQSLVESHNSADGSFDDFVKGKGLGLVINLFGPPGIGKTFTVEATSEHLKRPLYVVSAGDLGTTPSELDQKLTKIFSFVHKWNAVVLIDEADVFLEARNTADVDRNAMVAVFLRQLEYFPGILFLTTNRIKHYDLAFQSRIHLSLHYSQLSQDAKEQLWRAFLKKAQGPELRDADLKNLARKDLNGRQIKNAVKLAAAVAKHEQKPLTYEHILTTMRVMDDWEWKEEVAGLQDHISFG